MNNSHPATDALATNWTTLFLRAKKAQHETLSRSLDFDRVVAGAGNDKQGISAPAYGRLALPTYLPPYCPRSVIFDHLLEPSVLSSWKLPATMIVCC